MGSRCDREVLMRQTDTDGGGGRMEEGIKTDPETVETGGEGGDRIKLLIIATENRNIAVTF